MARYKQSAAGSRPRSVALISSTLGYSRQYYYKHCKEKEHFLFQQQQVKQLVDKERKVLPRLGGKKLYHQIQPCLQHKGIKMGRDKLFKLLGYYNLLIKTKRRYIQTTMSKHWLRKYPNLIKEQTVTRPEQVWVSDITCIKTDQGNCYLNLVTDAYSRKIMGYAIADSMDTTHMKKAFEMAVNNRKYPANQLIHHSDRGLQYCSQEYVQIAVENGIKISMTEQSDPYENALAERMNRTLKEEFGLGQPIKTKQQAFYLTKEAINLYNHYRPHLSLKMKTPSQVH